jgi:HSP20 family molecular chaperone IbpA
MSQQALSRESSKELGRKTESSLREVGNNPTEVERTRNRRTMTPPTDIWETPEAIYLAADMPGVAQKNVNITLEQDLLTIDGTSEESAPQGYSLVYGEYQPTDFRRQFTISTQINREKIQAVVKDGVLTVILPKAEPARAHKIEVRAG